jgi:predicted metal-dependent phosphoesterase TrpH
MDVDLHLHTTASDGMLRPADLVKACAAASLDVIALADHDTLAGSIEAIETARRLSIHVVPAIEISASGADLDLHILGYFVDPSSAELRAYTRDAKDQRERRLGEMLDRLRAQGFGVEFEAVVAASDGKGTVGRPHLARALVKAGHASSEQDAFERFIGNASPAYVPNSLVNPEEAIALIARAGGVPVWAHPPMYQIDAVLPILVGFGLRGIEAYRPGMLPSKVMRLEAAARANRLLLSGGSDWHGPASGPVGTFRVRAEQIAELLAVGGI